MSARVEPESEQVENKRSLNEIRPATEAIAAFATAQGGMVRFGRDGLLA